MKRYYFTAEEEYEEGNWVAKEHESDVGEYVKYDDALREQSEFKKSLMESIWERVVAQKQIKELKNEIDELKKQRENQDFTILEACTEVRDLGKALNEQIRLRKLWDSVRVQVIQELKEALEWFFTYNPHSFLADGKYYIHRDYSKHEGKTPLEAIQAARTKESL